MQTAVADLNDDNDMAFVPSKRDNHSEVPHQFDKDSPALYDSPRFTKN